MIARKNCQTLLQGIIAWNYIFQLSAMIARKNCHTLLQGIIAWNYICQLFQERLILDKRFQAEPNSFMENLNFEFFQMKTYRMELFKHLKDF